MTLAWPSLFALTPDELSCRRWSHLGSACGHEHPAQDEQTLTEATFLQQLLLFLNTYLMLQEGNKAVVFAVDGTGRSANKLPSALS